MWTAIAFWFCVVWATVCLLIALLKSVRGGDLVGFILQAGEGAMLIIVACVLSGALQ